MSLSEAAIFANLKIIVMDAGLWAEALCMIYVDALIDSWPARNKNVGIHSRKLDLGMRLAKQGVNPAPSFRHYLL